MGKDHVNSNDFGKGADIFNDVPKMIGTAIEYMEKGIRSIENENRGVVKRNVNSLDTIGRKINELRHTSAKFNEYRENTDFRTANGGEGDPDNADKFSDLKSTTLKKIEQLFSFMYYDEPYMQKRKKHEDWGSVTYCRQFRNAAFVEDRTFDKMAYDARKQELKVARDNGMISGFDKWYIGAHETLIQTFDQLADVVEDFYNYKNQIISEKRDASGKKEFNPRRK